MEDAPTKLYPLSIFIYKGVMGELADLSLIAKENEKSVKKQLQAI